MTQNYNTLPSVATPSDRQANIFSDFLRKTNLLIDIKAGICE